jgi:hypothetical protein
MTYADRYGLIDLVHYRGSDCLGDTPLSAFLLQISRTEPPEFAASIRAIRRHVLAGRWEAAEEHAVALVTGSRLRRRRLKRPSRRRRMPMEVDLACGKDGVGGCAAATAGTIASRHAHHKADGGGGERQAGEEVVEQLEDRGNDLDPGPTRSVVPSLLPRPRHPA